MAISCIRDLLAPSLPPSPSPQSTRRLKKSKKRGKGSTSSLPPIQFLDSNAENSGEGEAAPYEASSGNGTTDTTARFEDPVSVYAFIHSSSSRDMMRMESVPWDMHHHWDGDEEHSHTHCEAMEPSPRTERLRSYSEGESASLHSVPVVQPTLMHQILEDSEDKHQVT